MQIDIHRERKTVCIWLSRKETSEYKISVDILEEEDNASTLIHVV